MPRRLRKQRQATRAGRLRCFEKLENRRLLSADLRITDLYLRDYLGKRVETAPIGEQIEVVAEWESSNLDINAKYDVRFTVNGFELTLPNQSKGAGASSANSSIAQLGWYAQEGINTMEVLIDSNDTISELSETNNRITRHFIASTPSPPSRFRWPVDGKMFDVYGASSYYDIDPSTGRSDYLGRTGGNDNHFGWDIESFGGYDAQDRGRAILASADGEVIFAADGIFDRETTLRGQQESNYILLDHGDGWASYYGHIRRDGVLVNPGERVFAGQAIGLIGSSGNSGGAHLHFHISHNGRFVDPMLARFEVALFRLRG